MLNKVYYLLIQRLPLLFKKFIQVTPWTRVLLEKLTVTRLVKKFPPFMETMFTIAHYWSLY